MGGASTTVGELLAVLTRHPGHAMFVTELVARLGAAAPSTDDIESALRSLVGDRVVVVDHHPPDPHLIGDLRVVALAMPPATDPAGAAERVWNTWVREALTAHRCC